MKDFIANIYELGGLCYFGDFSKYMYKADLYGEVTLLTILIPLVVFFIYYKPLDHIRLAKTGIWATLLLAVSLITSMAAEHLAEAGIEDYLVQHQIQRTTISTVDSFWFSIIVFLYAAILSFVFSIVFKVGSSRSRRIPF